MNGLSEKKKRVRCVKYMDTGRLLNYSDVIKQDAGIVCPIRWTDGRIDLTPV
jgi:hypothetical protein